MSQWQTPDLHHLRAAEGWLELGNPREAMAELDQLSDEAQGRLEVLAVRWGILAHFKRWQEGVAVAARMIEMAPDEVFGWIHRSYALHELKRTQEARDLLLNAVVRFPQNEIIPYNLACYECQSGNHVIAMKWLQQAMRRGDPAEIKSRALEDEDLQPLWSEIRAMKAGGRKRE